MQNFHLQCTKLSENILQVLTNSRNACFKCDDCVSVCYKPLESKIEKLENRLTVLESAFASQNVEPLTTHPPATVPRIQPARTAKKAVNVFSQHLQTSQPPPPAETVKTGDARSRSLSTIVGTGPAVASIRLAVRFWLYVSNLNPASDDEDLMK
jgi:hypothetical protein